MRRLLIIFLFVCLVGLPEPTKGEMSSADYLIYADSVNSGGGFASGGVYNLENTFGETPADYATSSLYEIHAGYQYMVRGELSLTVSANSLSLGTLSQTAVNSASTILSVVTDCATGFSMSISSVSGASISAVSDGAISAGSEEYGFSASGGDSLVSGDVPVAQATVLASSSTPVTLSETTMTFKAAMSAATTPGDYSQSLTVTASANL